MNFKPFNIFWIRFHGKSLATLHAFTALYILLIIGAIYGVFYPDDTFTRVVLGGSLPVLFILLMVNRYFIWEKRNIGQVRGDRPFEGLWSYYKNTKLIAHANLIRIYKARKAEDDRKPTVGELMKFPVSAEEEFLCENLDGKRISNVFGLFDQNGTFLPLLTQFMLDTRGIMDFVNQQIDENSLQKAATLERSLQQILMISLYLEECFSYMDWKRIVLEKVRAPEAIKDELQKSVAKKMKNVSDRMKVYFAELKESSVGRGMDEELLGLMRLGNFSWVGYDVAEDGHNINGYLLPKEYAMPYLIKKWVGRNRNKLVDLIGILSKGDASTIMAAVREKGSQIGTARGSANYNFLSMLVSGGMAEELPIEVNLPDGLNERLTSFRLIEQHKPIIIDLLIAARLDFDEIEKSKGLLLRSLD